MARLLILLALFLGGCAAPPLKPGDPPVYRPAHPVYPIPPPVGS